MIRSMLYLLAAIGGIFVLGFSVHWTVNYAPPTKRPVLEEPPAKPPLKPVELGVGQRVEYTWEYGHIPKGSAGVILETPGNDYCENLYRIDWLAVRRKDGGMWCDEPWEFKVVSE